MIEASDIREMEAQVASEAGPASSEALRYYMKRKKHEQELDELFKNWRYFELTDIRQSKIKGTAQSPIYGKTPVRKVDNDL
jgi:hypothetical protein